MAVSTERAQAGLAYFKSLGYPDVAAAAIIGSGIQESGLNPEAIHDSGTGLGAFGWRDPSPGQGRKTALTQFAVERGKPATDFLTQLAFVDHELRTSEKGVGDRLRGAASLEDATDAMIGFERPRGWTPENPRGGDGWQNRLDYAKELLGGAAPIVPPSQPDLGGAVDPAPVSLVERWQQEQEDKAEGPGLWGTLTTAVDQDSLTKRLWESVFGDRPFFQPDLDFRLDEQRIKDLQDAYGLQDDNLTDLDEAVSAPHAEWLAKQIQDRQDREETLARAGVTGVGARLAVNMFDPSALAAAVASGGIANMAAGAMRLGRVGRVALFAAEGGASNAAIDAASGGDENSVMFAAGAGMVLGAGFGALSRAAPDLAADMSRVGREVMDQARAPTGSTAGAMQAAPKFPLRDAAVDFANVDAPTTAYAGKLRQDMVGSLKSSENPMMRAIGNVLGEDAVASVDKSGTVLRTAFGATERQAKLQRQMEAKVLQGYMPAWQEWAKKQNLPAYQRWWGGEKWHEFNEEVTAFMRNTDPSMIFSPEVVKAGKVLQGAYKDYVQIAQNPGIIRGTVRRAIAGFQGVDPNLRYVPRLYDFHKLNQIITTHGEQEVIQLFMKALQEQQIKLEDEVAHRVASGMVKKLRERSADLSSRLDRPLGSDDEQYLIDSLKGLGVDELDAASLAKQLRPQKDAQAGPRGKFRALLNEQAVHRTRAGGEIRFTDLLQNNAMDLFQAYNRDMSGRVALAQVDILDRDGKVLVDGITHDGEFGKLVDAARAMGDSLGIEPGNTGNHVKTLETLYRAVLGQADPSEAGFIPQVTRTVMNYNFLRLMNNMGIAQAVEAGSIVGNLGLRATIAGVPAFKGFLRDARSGLYKDELNQEIEAILGIGVDDLKGAMPARYDADYFGDALNPAFERADQLARQGARIVNRASGMQWINRRLQVIAMRGIAYKFSEMAANPTKINMKRMLTLGLDEPMLNRVLSEFKAHKSQAAGEFGKITRMNLDRWTDLEARAAFEDSVFRWGRRIIQENDPGALPRFMQHRLGKMLFQFRTFMLGAFFKQTLWHMKMRDREALSTLMWSMMIGTVAYTAQTLGQSVGRSDREEFLKERLALGALAPNVFQRTGMSSILPMVMDGAFGMVSKGDTIFSGRTTGQSSDPFLGNPAFSLYGDLSNALGSIVSPIVNGRAPGQNEVRNAFRALPYGNSMFLQAPLSALISGLPERAAQD
ncbi:phage tail tip lysozyme [Inquilinus limosus]|uniref:phage tail tip lysozyme n=1 Tax=Inquilinus limosus TaxID=171674 RepID=UPI00068C74D9|nr:phage tail tip lysozyme [Inquilinus limosus]